MWTCPECKRIFQKAKQPHSCRNIPLEQHFKNKDKAKELFDFLVSSVNSKVGAVQVISIPCCVHLFGTYDFLAVLPRKNRMEIRFGLDRQLNNPRLKVSVPMSSKVFKNCLVISSKQEIDDEFMGWLKESYYLRS